MNKNIVKKLLTVFMIITILASDFFVLGSNLITYAMQLDKNTNNSNIEFSVYFKDGANKVDSIRKSIKNNDLKLYAEIKVKNEGYLKDGTVIEIADSNFNLKDESLLSNKYISSIVGNKVTLKQINSSENVEIELNVEPIIKETMSADFLSKISTVKLNGTYVYSGKQKGETIKAEKSVCANYQPDETTEAELKTNIITNKVLAVHGTNKRLVQLLVKSRLTNNEYPVKQTTLKVSVPELSGKSPEISILATGELATNGKTEISKDSWKVENGELQILINNDPDANNEINWNKNSYDEMIITYVYPEDVDASKIEITTNSEIKLHNSENTYTAKYTKGIENQELNNVVTGKTEIITEEMYKGLLYANKDKQYNTKTSIIVTNANILDKIEVKENADVFGTKESEIIANSKYITTEINLEKMLAILGQDGNIEIKNGTSTTIVNKDSKINEKGNVVINHENVVTELEIKTSKPVNAGILEINHAKAIIGGTYSREELQTVKTLKTNAVISGFIAEEKAVENNAKTNKSIIDLKETVSKAELTVDRTTLSTAETNEITVGIKLITNSEKYDLYKNPSITLQMPKAVENVEFITTPSKIEADEFKTITQNYDPANKTITVTLKGEQTSYPETSLQQAYIQLKLNAKISKLALSEMDKITMQYVNENAVQYENGTTCGVAEQSVEISSPNEIVTRFNISSNENKSLTETILQQVEEKNANSIYDFEIELINNNDSDIENLKILGKLPTIGNTISGQSENTLETKLTNIVAENAQIYYTQNASATADIENPENGWTGDLSTLTNAKLYLIKVNSLARGANYKATLKVQMPSAITENALSYTQYEVIYDTTTKTEVKENSRKIGLLSSLVASIQVDKTAQVGSDVLKNGDSVKEGEVIKYTLAVRNNGAETLRNVQLKLDVPEGTVFVRPIERYVFNEGTADEWIAEEGAYVYLSNVYYEEITDKDKLAELTNITIPELAAGAPYIIEYEVRVNKGSAGSEISNKSEVIYNGSSNGKQELKNIVEEANVRVTIKRAIDVSNQLFANGDAEYIAYVENLSDSTIKNFELKVIAEGLKIESINDIETSGKMSIDEITAKGAKKAKDDLEESGIKTFAIKGKINKNTENISIYAVVRDSEREEYRSNKLTEKIPQVKATINMSSPQNGQSVKEGDIVKYNITVKNTGNIESVLQIYDIIPEYLQVQSIAENNQVTMINEEKTAISNDIEYAVTLKPQEQLQLEIVTKVLYIPEELDGKTITNMAKVKIEEAFETNSQIITHALNANSTNENIGNTISGFAWFDANANGRKDIEENVIEVISVKLYDVSSNHYLTDDKGNIIQVSTDSNGEYNFSKIKNGSYLIIFEFDNEKYEITKAFAEGVDTSLNSKVGLKNIDENGQQTRIYAIETSNLTQNMFDMNIGLKENTGDTSPEDKPTTPEDPENPEKPDESKDQKTISGLAWLDSNRNGQKDDSEDLLAGIKVKIYDIKTKQYLKDAKGNIIETTTDGNGKYVFNNIEKGSYILIFEYDVDGYEPTAYMAEGVDATRNSKVILNKINIDGKETTVAVTDTIVVKDNVSNINIGLKEKLIFDLELNKYISKVVVQNAKGTKTYESNGKALSKVEINKKQLQGSLVVLEYTIKVKNNGEISGYAKNIVDYLPSGVTFNSELNKDWYLSGNNLYTKSLENAELKPGEEKEVKLVLTKTMTSENVGLINNRAEIYKDYNKYGEADMNSTPNNQVQGENDMSFADVIIGISTGLSLEGNTTIYTMLLLVNMALIAMAVKLMIKNKIIRISSKKRGRR